MSSSYTSSMTQGQKSAVQQGLSSIAPNTQQLQSQAIAQGAASLAQPLPYSTQPSPQQPLQAPQTTLGATLQRLRQQ